MVKQEKTPEIKVRHPKALEFERKVEDAKHFEDIIDLIRGFIEVAIPNEIKRKDFSKGIVLSLTTIVQSMFENGRSGASVVPLFQRIAKEAVLGKLEPFLLFPQVQKTEVVQKETIPQLPETVSEKSRSFPELVEQAILQRINGNLSCVQCEEARTDVPFVVRPEMRQAVKLFISSCVLPLLQDSSAINKQLATIIPEKTDVVEYLGVVLENTMVKPHPIYPVWDVALQKFVQRVETAIPEKEPEKPKKPEAPKKAKFGSPEYNAYNRALGVYNKALEEYNDYEPRKQAHALWQEMKSLFSGEDSSFTVQAFHDVLKMGLRANQQDIKDQVSQMDSVVENFDGQHTHLIYAVSNQLLDIEKSESLPWGNMIVLHAFLKQGTKRNLALRNLARGSKDNLESIQFILNYLNRHQLSL